MIEYAPTANNGKVASRGAGKKSKRRKATAHHSTAHGKGPSQEQQENFIMIKAALDHHLRTQEHMRRFEIAERAKRLKKMSVFVQAALQGQIEDIDQETALKLRTVLDYAEQRDQLGPERWMAKRRADAKDAFFAKMHAKLEPKGRRMKRQFLSRKKTKETAKVSESDERARLWTLIFKKQIPKAARLMSQMTAARQASARKVAALCAKEQQKAQVKLQKNEAREVATRAKRAMKEMLQFWKRNEREERELRKRAEKEAAERRRQEEEEREARRQDKKLHFLITQTELYSHFIARKTGAPPTTDTKVGSGGSGKRLTAGVDFADLDEAAIAEQAQMAAQSAAAAQKAKLRTFDAESDKHRREAGGESSTLGQELVDNLDFKAPSTLTEGLVEIRQPRMLQCQLKGYQGINGILADEMGLGKTVQAISLMAHLAETHNIWGPFLVISPASTLHNWQQEISRFVPSLRALPYWGSVNDRKTLRRFWNPKKLYSRDSHFHILITSYQLVVTDEKYFQKIKWQYMILDEAQAIKSSSSVRWKTLLSFQCRNRLLLTGTPIQNSMQELWALLHFIMPGLFDSHDEFSEWFSRDIESHAVAAESKTGSSTLNEHQLQRLHMILKPFMLRRVKKDVENELGAKIEIDVDCSLSGRQKSMYRAIKEKLPLAELLDLSSASTASAASDNLMNIVMQFRKVCNHPELFERSEIRSPFVLHQLDKISLGDRDASLFWNGPLPNPVSLTIPKLVINAIEDRTIPLSSIFDPINVFRPLGQPDDPLSALAVFDPLLLSRNEVPVLMRDGPVALAKLIEEHRQQRLDTWLSHPDALEHLWMPWERPHLRADPIKFIPEPVQTLLRMPALYCPRAISMPINAFVEDLNYTLRNAPQPMRKEDIHVDLMEIKKATPGAGLYIQMPNMNKLITDCGKMRALDKLLSELKEGGHRVLIYNQMTKMIDLMEEYLHYRGYTYIRLDGSSKIADRRDLVSDWQSRPDIFVFLLSTRAGGLGINLTAADTVIFYDSDWNPTVDQQAMDRAHRLGQTKQVTVYRLITRNSIEERMRQRAKQKDEIHKVVIAGGEFRQQLDARPNQKDIVSLLLDEEEGDQGDEYHDRSLVNKKPRLN